MYRDTVGRVTVGVGLMLPSAATACALPFQTAEGAAATAEQVAAEFARVDAMAMEMCIRDSTFSYAQHYTERLT